MAGPCGDVLQGPGGEAAGPPAPASSKGIPWQEQGLQGLPGTSCAPGQAQAPVPPPAVHAPLASVTAEEVVWRTVPALAALSLVHTNTTLASSPGAAATPLVGGAAPALAAGSMAALSAHHVTQSAAEPTDAAQAGECAMCLDAPRSVAMVPCAHVCLCPQCADALERRHREQGRPLLCPYCR